MTNAFAFVLGNSTKGFTPMTDINELIKRAKIAMDKMTPEELDEMKRKQREGWVRAEIEWAREFREGKCKYD